MSRSFIDEQVRMSKSKNLNLLVKYEHMSTRKYPVISVVSHETLEVDRQLMLSDDKLVGMLVDQGPYSPS